jgi:hypothetical protein
VEPALSLWLVPPEPDRARLRAAIERLARLGTPPFAPHLTLLSRLRLPAADARARALALADTLRPLPLRLWEVSHSAAFFRCVVLEAEPSSAVLGARRAAEQAMGVSAAEPYRPHLSLVYGDLEAEQRAGLAAEARTLLPVPLETSATSLELWDTTGPPRQWTPAGAFPLA